MTSELASGLSGFAHWRANVASEIAAYQRWLETHRLADSHAVARLDELRGKLHEERLTVAFVAEFSRGKSELINAILFSDYRRRIVPSSSGPTTMCPTELLWDPSMEPCIRLLPIETRAAPVPLSEFRKLPEEWRVVAIDVNSPGSLADAFQALRETRRVSPEEARKLGLWREEDPRSRDGELDEVLIPEWRHAIINFPHPLLQQGLVILDTPGFNAPGAEPDLTLDLLAQAHAIVYLLALDTGVTKSDLAVWREVLSVSGVRDQLRYAVLNKIDTIWDGLRGEADIEAEILQQRSQCAELLQIEPSRVFPVSAQKGLLARIIRDEALLDRSRLPLLEQAICANLLPQRRKILGNIAREEIVELMDRSKEVLLARRTNVQEQLAELLALHGKNADVAAHMMRRTLQEKRSFESSMAKFQALRQKMSGVTNELFTELGIDPFTQETRRLLENALASQFRFTSNLRSAMQWYVDGCRERLGKAALLLAGLQRLASTLYETLEQEHGLRLGALVVFSLLRHQRELQRLQQAFEAKFNSLRALLGSEDRGLLHKFAQTVVGSIYHVFTSANSGIDYWLKAVIAPVEAQIRESQSQIRRRLESIKQIRNAAGTIDARIAELKATESDLSERVAEVTRMAERLDRMLESTGAPGSVAAAA